MGVSGCQAPGGGNGEGAGSATAGEAHDPPIAPSGDGGAHDGFPRLVAGTVCPQAGYLCQAMDGATPHRVRRWPDDSGTLTVRIAPPPVPDPVLQAELHRAAVRGLLAWDGVPFRLRIQDRDGGRALTGGAAGTVGSEGDEAGAPDISVSWVTRLEGGRLGEVRTVWAHRGPATRFQVERFAVALEVRGRPLTPAELQRVTAHEMGHALGLEHSDDPRDLMYPENTAAALSVRDYRTLQALYALPEGAVLLP